MVHSFDTGTPVITIQIPNTNENTQNLNFRRWPLKGGPRVSAATPAPQPKTLRLSLIQLGPRGWEREREPGAALDLLTMEAAATVSDGIIACLERLRLAASSWSRESGG